MEQNKGVVAKDAAPSVRQRETAASFDLPKNKGTGGAADVAELAKRTKLVAGVHNTRF
jgi:hypothetical protein